MLEVYLSAGLLDYLEEDVAEALRVRLELGDEVFELVGEVLLEKTRVSVDESRELVRHLLEGFLDARPGELLEPALEGVKHELFRLGVLVVGSHLEDELVAGELLPRVEVLPLLLKLGLETKNSLDLPLGCLDLLDAVPFHDLSYLGDEVREVLHGGVLVAEGVEELDGEVEGGFLRDEDLQTDLGDLLGTEVPVEDLLVGLSDDPERVEDERLLLEEGLKPRVDQAQLLRDVLEIPQLRLVTDRVEVVEVDLPDFCGQEPEGDHVVALVVEELLDHARGDHREQVVLVDTLNEADESFLDGVQLEVVVDHGGVRVADLLLDGAREEEVDLEVGPDPPHPAHLLLEVLAAVLNLLALQVDHFIEQKQDIDPQHALVFFGVCDVLHLLLHDCQDLLDCLALRVPDNYIFLFQAELVGVVLGLHCLDCSPLSFLLQNQVVEVFQVLVLLSLDIQLDNVDELLHFIVRFPFHQVENSSRCLLIEVLLDFCLNISDSFPDSSEDISHRIFSQGGGSEIFLRECDFDTLVKFLDSSLFFCLFFIVFDFHDCREGFFF